MDKQAVIRRVRIAVSLFFGVLTLAVLVLWVRSYRQVTALDIVGYRIEFKQGKLDVVERAQPSIRPYPGLPVGTAVARFLANIASTSVVVVSIPLWIPASIAGLLTVAPWLRAFWTAGAPRFSLRAMLTATTLVAVVLGLGAWLAS